MTEAYVTAKKGVSARGLKWEEGNRYKIVCGPKGFTLESESGVGEYTYPEIDRVLQDFEVPQKYVL